MLTPVLQSILLGTNPYVAKKVTLLISEHAPEVLLNLLHRLVVRCHSGPYQAERMWISVVDIDAAIWGILKQVLCHVAACRS